MSPSTIMVFNVFCSVTCAAPIITPRACNVKAKTSLFAVRAKMSPVASFADWLYRVWLLSQSVWLLSQSGRTRSDYLGFSVTWQSEKRLLEIQ